MRSIIIILMLALSLSFAQSDNVEVTEPERGGIYAGLSLGVGTRLALPLTAHVGFKDAGFEGIDTRIDFATFILVGSTSFELGVNEIYTYQIAPDLPWEIQAGGGFRFIFGGGGALFGIGGVGGADYSLTDQVDLFGELRFDSYLGGLATKFALGFGAKYNF